MEKSSALGIGMATLQLGDMYYNGIGVHRDYKKGIELYEIAKDQGCAQGYNNLGMAYGDGKYFPPDADKARKMFEKAAEGGVAQAYYNLGLIYEFGRGNEIKTDYKKAVELYQKAVDAGVQQALLAIMRCVKKYEDGKKDLKERPHRVNKPN